MDGMHCIIDGTSILVKIKSVALYNCQTVYIVVCALPGSTTFFTLSHKQHDFRQTFVERKICVLIFSSTFVWNIFYSTKNLAKCDHEYT